MTDSVRIRYLRSSLNAAATGLCNAVSSAETIEGSHRDYAIKLAEHLSDLRRSLESVMKDPKTLRIFEEAQP